MRPYLLHINNLLHKTPGVLLLVSLLQSLKDDLLRRPDNKHASLFVHEQLDGFQHLDDTGTGTSIQVVYEDHQCPLGIVRFLPSAGLGCQGEIGPDQPVEKCLKGGVKPWVSL